MADEPSGIVMQALRRVRSHPVALAVTVIAVSAVIAVFAGGGAGRDGTQRVRTVADEVAAPPTTRPDGVAPTSAAPTADDAVPLGTPIEAPPTDASQARTHPTSHAPAADNRVTGDGPVGRSAATSPDHTGDPRQPPAPKSWSDRIFFAQEAIPFGQASAVWSVDLDGQDLRIEAPGLLNGPGDQFGEGARLGFDVSADRSTLLFTQFEAVPYWDALTSEVHALHLGGKSSMVASGVMMGNPRFAPDGQRLVVATEQDARILDLDGTVLRMLAVGANFNGGDDFAWAPTGDRIALAQGAGQVQIIDVASALTTEVIPIGSAELAWSPDGDTLALSGWFGGVGGIHLFDTTTWQEVAALPVTDLCNPLGCKPTNGLSWWPDGRSIAYAGAAESGTLYELDIDSGESRVLFRAPTTIYRPKVT